MYLNTFENGLTVPIYPPLFVVIATWSANKQTCALSLRHANDPHYFARSVPLKQTTQNPLLVLYWNSPAIPLISECIICVSKHFLTIATSSLIHGPALRINVSFESKYSGKVSYKLVDIFSVILITLSNS